MFRDREGCRFLCLIGEGAPRREAGDVKSEVRKDPRSKAWPAFLSRGECSGREAELDERLKMHLEPGSSPLFRGIKTAQGGSLYSET